MREVVPAKAVVAEGEGGDIAIATRMKTATRSAMMVAGRVAMFETAECYLVAAATISST